MALGVCGSATTPEGLGVSVRQTKSGTGPAPKIVQALTGEYDRAGENHGKPVFQRRRTPHAGPDEEVFVYYWDEIDEVDAKDPGSWWFGSRVGADEVWAWNPFTSAVPPETGWELGEGPGGSFGLELSVALRWRARSPAREAVKVEVEAAEQNGSKSPLRSRSRSCCVGVRACPKAKLRRATPAVAVQARTPWLPVPLPPPAGLTPTPPLPVSAPPPGQWWSEPQRPAAGSRQPPPSRGASSDSRDSDEYSTSSASDSMHGRWRPSPPKHNERPALQRPAPQRPREVRGGREEEPPWRRGAPPLPPAAAAALSSRASPPRRREAGPGSRERRPEALQCAPGGRRIIDISNQKLSDEGLRRWLERSGQLELQRFGYLPLADLNASRNVLTDEGVSFLVDFLLKRRQGTRRLKLFENRLREPNSICRLIEDRLVGAGTRGGLAELHLSHNELSAVALGRILDSLRRRARTCGGLRPPFWLRVESNRGLEDFARDIAEMHRDKGLRLCMRGTIRASGCNIRSCRQGADVHLHIKDRPATAPPAGRGPERCERRGSELRRRSGRDFWQRSRSPLRPRRERSDSRRERNNSRCANHSRTVKADRRSRQPVPNRDEVDRRSRQSIPDRAEADRGSWQPVLDRDEVDRRSRQSIPDRAEADRRSWQIVPDRDEADRRSWQIVLDRDEVDRRSRQSIPDRAEADASPPSQSPGSGKDTGSCGRPSPPPSENGEAGPGSPAPGSDNAVSPERHAESAPQEPCAPEGGSPEPPWVVESSLAGSDSSPPVMRISEGEEAGEEQPLEGGVVVQLTRRSSTYEEAEQEDEWWPRWREASWQPDWRGHWWDGWDDWDDWDGWDDWRCGACDWSEGSWRQERTRPSPFRLQLSDQGLEDEDIRRWCDEVGWWEMRRNQHQQLDAVDLSNNQLTDAGVDAFVDFLAEAGKPTRRLKLFGNGLREPLALCRLIEDANLGPGAKEGLRELHLSRNAITLQAVRHILDSLLRRRRQLHEAFAPPVWLRVERNEGFSEDSVTALAKEFQAAGLGVCTEARTGARRTCSIAWCRYGADVHMHTSGSPSTRPSTVERGSSHWQS